MPLPLLIAGGVLAGAGAYSAYKGLSKKTPKAQAATQAPVNYGGSGFNEGQLRRDLVGTEQAASEEAARYRGMSDEARAQAMQARGMESDLYGRYGALSRGEGPSLARAQMASGLNAAQRQAGQVAANTRGGGGNRLAASRAAMQTGADLAGQTAGRTAELAQQEQLAALAAQGSLAGQMRQGDLALRQGDFAGSAMLEARASDRLQGRLGMEGDIYRGQLGAAAANQQTAMQAQAQNAAAAQAQKDRWMQLAGGLLQGGGALAGKGA